MADIPMVPDAPPERFEVAAEAVHDDLTMEMLKFETLQEELKDLQGEAEVKLHETLAARARVLLMIRQKHPEITRTMPWYGWKRWQGKWWVVGWRPSTKLEE